ncbi:LysR family transcriptional regulator [Kitasatospora kifunensis]|uniref:DNA-binding transcriptional LysR family regulator n=1 Tax=Kitasatospora kifunensis TaxID=58351 RepID=A0A7W7R797_KITKI|nr:LysR substrate-binding domain-containing protein [Kitasatospora kifunensis]MBB4926733.1 DNA-binding transcriptional LysR family regulator [Kitasatospora kifunensis]
MDVDLRKLRYFVAVAEELHFGRAAERLHIAQPVLSRQIRALETELRAQLFRRDRRSTELTAAGRQLLEDAPPLLAASQAARRRVGLAGQEQARFTIGFMPGITVTAAVRAFSTRHPDLTVDVLRTSWDDQSQVILDGRVDVGFIRLPVDQRGLELRPLFAEPRVVVLPTGHRLAGQASVGIADLADEQLLQNPDAVPEWRDLPTHAGSRPERSRPLAATVEEKLEYVAAADGMVILPLSTARFYTRPDLVHLAVEGIGPSQVCLAWSAGRRSRLLDEFRQLAASAAG